MYVLNELFIKYWHIYIHTELQSHIIDVYDPT